MNVIYCPVHTHRNARVEVLHKQGDAHKTGQLQHTKPMVPKSTITGRLYLHCVFFVVTFVLLEAP